MYSFKSESQKNPRIHYHGFMKICLIHAISKTTVQMHIELENKMITIITRGKGAPSS